MDYLKLVSDKEVDLKPRFDRMDIDRDLYHLTPFKLQDRHGREAPNVKNVTLNDPLVFANYIRSVIQGAENTPIVQSLTAKNKVKDKETSLIERFLVDLWAMATQRSKELNLEIAGLDAFFVEQLVIRGWLVARYLSWKEGEDFVPDLIPFDARYVTYEIGKKGWDWVAYKTKRSKAKIDALYSREIIGTDATVTVFYDDEYERTFLEKDLIKEWRHDEGYVPFIIQPSYSGSMLMDSNNEATKRRGESIFAADREIFEVMNENATVFNTVAGFQFKPPLQYFGEDGEKAEPEIPDWGSLEGVVTPVSGEGYKAMPLQDLHRAALQNFSILEQRKQWGSLPAIMFGSLTFPMSAIGIQRLSTFQDQLYSPRLDALKAFKQAIAEMAIKQYVAKKINAEVGRKGHKTKYKWQDIKKAEDCEIIYLYSLVSPEQNIANVSLAAAMGDLVSYDYKRREIVKLKNPDNEDLKVLSEQADRLVPNLSLYKMAKAKLEAGEEIEARIIATEIGLTLEQLESGQIGGIKKKPSGIERPPKQVLPMIGGQAAGRGGTAQTAQGYAEREVETGRPTEEQGEGE